jgi:hypothetical protein
MEPSGRREARKASKLPRFSVVASGLRGLATPPVCAGVLPALHSLAAPAIALTPLTLALGGRVETVGSATECCSRYNSRQVVPPLAGLPMVSARHVRAQLLEIEEVDAAPPRLDRALMGQVVKRA